MAKVIPIEEIANGYVALGLGGVTVAGATSPAACNGEYVRAGDYGSKPYYTHTTASYFLWWSTGSSRWNLTATLGGATVLFYRASAAVNGSYTNGTGTGTVTATLGPVYGMQLEGVTPQTVLTPYSGQGHEDIIGYTRRYSFQVAVYHTSEWEALARAEAAYTALDAKKGSTTAASGWTLSSLTARSLTVQPPALVEVLSITGGQLYKVVFNVHLENLHTT